MEDFPTLFRKNLRIIHSLSFIHSSSIHPFIQQILLNTYTVSGTVLDSRNSMVNTTRNGHNPGGVYIIQREREMLTDPINKWKMATGVRRDPQCSEALEWEDFAQSGRPVNVPPRKILHRDLKEFK